MVDLTQMNPAILKVSFFNKERSFMAALMEQNMQATMADPRLQGQIRILMINKEHRGIRTVA